MAAISMIIRCLSSEFMLNLEGNLLFEERLLTAILSLRLASRTETLGDTPAACVSDSAGLGVALIGSNLTSHGSTVRPEAMDIILAMRSSRDASILSLLLCLSSSLFKFVGDAIEEGKLLSPSFVSSFVLDIFLWGSLGSATA